MSSYIIHRKDGTVAPIWVKPGCNHFTVQWQKNRGRNADRIGTPMLYAKVELKTLLEEFKSDPTVARVEYRTWNADHMYIKASSFHSNGEPEAYTASATLYWLDNGTIEEWYAEAPTASDAIKAFWSSWNTHCRTNRKPSDIAFTGSDKYQKMYVYVANSK